MIDDSFHKRLRSIERKLRAGEAAPTIPIYDIEAPVYTAFVPDTTYTANSILNGTGAITHGLQSDTEYFFEFHWKQSPNSTDLYIDNTLLGTVAPNSYSAGPYPVNSMDISVIGNGSPDTPTMIYIRDLGIGNTRTGHEYLFDTLSSTPVSPPYQQVDGVSATNYAGHDYTRFDNLPTKSTVTLQTAAFSSSSEVWLSFRLMLPSYGGNNYIFYSDISHNPTIHLRGGTTYQLVNRFVGTS